MTNLITGIPGGAVTRPWRLVKSPQPGDLVRWPSAGLGRIWTSDDGRHPIHANELQVCETLGQAHLLPDGRIDVRGGPFLVVHRTELEPLMELGQSPVWTWNDQGTGPDHEAEFIIHRPVWRYVGPLRAPIPQFTPMEPIIVQRPDLQASYEIVDVIGNTTGKRIFSVTFVCGPGHWDEGGREPATTVSTLEEALVYAATHQYPFNPNPTSNPTRSTTP